MATLTEFCEKAILHAEGNRDFELRQSAFKNLMKGLVSQLLGGVPRWHDDRDEAQVAAQIDLAYVAEHCVELASRYAGGGPDRTAAVEKVIAKVGASTQSAAGIESTDVWTAVRDAVVEDLRLCGDVDYVALVDRVAERLERTSRRKKGRQASDAKAGADATLRSLIAKARANPPVGVADVAVDLQDEVKVLTRIREYAEDRDLFADSLTDDQMQRLVQVVVFEGPSRQPAWMQLAPAEWQFPQRWEEAADGEWTRERCHWAMVNARPADAPTDDSDRPSRHVEALPAHSDVENEIWAMFCHQLRRAHIKGFVLDRDPYDQGAKPTTWWNNIIQKKAPEAWDRVMQRPLRSGTLVSVGGYAQGDSDDDEDGDVGEDHNPAIGGNTTGPEMASTTSANRLPIAAASAVQGVSDRSKLLTGWDEQDAKEVVATAQAWLLENLVTELLKRQTRRHGLDGNIQKRCTEYLLDVHGLSSTQNEKQACRIAGILAERALYLAIQQGAAGDFGSADLAHRLKTTGRGSSRTRAFLDSM